MRQQLTENDCIFDGFAHRNFIENIDGWRNVIPDAADYPAVMAAHATLDIFEELCAAKHKIWELTKERDHYKAMCGM